MRKLYHFYIWQLTQNMPRQFWAISNRHYKSWMRLKHLEEGIHWDRVSDHAVTILPAQLDTIGRMFHDQTVQIRTINIPSSPNSLHIEKLDALGSGVWLDGDGEHCLGISLMALLTLKDK